MKKVWNIGKQHRAIPLPIAVWGHILYINSNYFIGWRPQWRNIEFDERLKKKKIYPKAFPFQNLPTLQTFLFWFLVARGDRLGGRMGMQKKENFKWADFKKLFSQRYI